MTSNEQIETPLSDKLERFLRDLEALSAKAPEWQITIPAFLQQLAELIQVRKDELQVINQKESESQLQRQLLQDELISLKLLPLDTLSFFAIDDCHDWAIDPIEAENLEQVHTSIVKLRRLLIDHQQLQERSQLSFQEKRKVRPELEELEQRIDLGLSHLRKFFPYENKSIEPEVAGQLDDSEDDPDTGVEHQASNAKEHKTHSFTADKADNDASPVSRSEETILEVDIDQMDLEADPTEDSSGDSAITLESTLKKIEPIETTSLAVMPEESSRVPQAEQRIAPRTNGETKEVQVEGADEFDWNNFFWERMMAGDLAGAYWIGRAMEAVLQSGKPAVLPSWLVAVNQGAWWTAAAEGQRIQGMSSLATAHSPGEQANEIIAATSASLVPALIAPAFHFDVWLKIDKRLPQSVNLIIKAVLEFAKFGHPLNRHDVLTIRGEDQREETRHDLTETATRWLKEAPQRKTKYGTANTVWVKWTRRNGPLYQMVEIVARNQDRDINNLSDLVAEWREYDNDYWLDQTHAEIMGANRHKIRRIEASPRERLLSQAEEAVRLAEEWLEVTQSEAGTTEWLQDRVKELVQTVEASKDAALEALSSLEKSASGDITPGTIRLLRWALTDLCGVLKIDYPKEHELERRLAHYPQGISPATLGAGLSYRLLWVPEIDLPDNLEVSAQVLPEVVRALHRAEFRGQTLSNALDKWIDRHDFRFVPLIIKNLETADSTASENIHDQLRQAQNRAQSELERKVGKTRDAVERAVVDGLIGEADRSNFASQLESIEKQSAARNYWALDKQLDGINYVLGQARRVHLDHQAERWGAVQKRLEEKAVDEQLSTDITEFVKDALAKQDIVVVDERLARLEEILDTGQLFDASEFDLESSRDVYQEFIEEMERWQDQFTRLHLDRVSREVRELIRSNRPHPIVSPERSLPIPRLEEVIQAFKNWQELKLIPVGKRAEVTTKVSTILRYLGYTFTVQPSQALEWKSSGGAWVHLTARMTASNLSPIPQFGSLQNGTQDVVCVWERPGAEVVQSLIERLELGINNIVVLFLGRLKTRHRLDLMRAARKDSLAWAVLDELLLLYLARETESRLKTFMRCALPMSSINPYMETGPVPPEMFFGRSDERKSLQQTTGYSLVFGGRQLGKSALLQQVEREFHSPELERFVIRRDIKMLGDPASNRADPELIWSDIRAGMEESGLLPKTTATTADTISQQIRTMMDEHLNRRVLVLLDETDNFLAADLNRNFEVVSRLKALMDYTNRRYKVVFAGLHNVQRYEGIPNQPLAHLPRLAVGPLEPFSARQLIIQPLEALGFRFPPNDESPVLGILAYTNYHPGLIQLFCQKLLQNMQRRPLSSLGPFTITRADVEAVYRQREVQEDIRRRFEWTLALDPRYKALTQIIVLDQLQDHDGFSKTYTLDDLLHLAGSLWPQAFQEASRDEFRGYLDEMVGLGVLVHNEEKKYRLRSPNLVRLMGSEEDIWGSLDELARQPASRTLEPDSHHASFESGTPCRYSPFTHRQARVLNDRVYGVGLVFGSSALGIDQVAEAFKAHFVPEGASGRVEAINIASLSSDALIRWLKDFADRNQGVERLIAYRHVHGSAEVMAEQIRAALEFTQRRKKALHWMRVIFIFDRVATQEWLTLTPEHRLALEEQADATITLNLWDSAGVAQRLSQQEKMDSERVVAGLIEDLGGWPFLLDLLADRWGERVDPLPICQDLRRELTQLGSDTRSRFLEATGINSSKRVSRVFREIATSSGVPEELLTPEMLGGGLSPAMSVQECDAVIEYLHRMALVSTRMVNDSREVVAQPLIKQLILESHAS